MNEGGDKQIYSSEHIHGPLQISIFIMLDQTSEFPKGQSCYNTKKNKEKNRMDTNGTDQYHNEYNAG